MAKVYTHPTKPNAPSFSFRGRESYDKKKDVPGPGDYQISDKLNKSSNKFGKEKRRSHSVSVAPGPGQYKIIDKAVEGPKYSMGGKISYCCSESCSPGPGNYETKKWEAQTYSFGTRREQKNPKLNISVSPTSYNNRTDVITPASPSFRFGTGQRSGTSFDDKRPGPGQYQPASKMIEGPTYGFGPKPKDKKIKYTNAHLGPATYTLPSWIDSKKGAIMAPRRPLLQDGQKAQVPGPGSYDQPILAAKQPTWKIGSEVRQSIANLNEVPGPGNYTMPARRIRSYGFGTSKRPGAGTNLTSSSPGPGSYVTPSLIQEGPSFSMYSRRASLSPKLSSPGPGNYNTSEQNPTVPRSPKFGMGSSKRADLTKSKVPGPGEYELRTQSQQGPKWQFGTEQRQRPYKCDNPGFSYDPPGTFPKVEKPIPRSSTNSPRNTKNKLNTSD